MGSSVVAGLNYLHAAGPPIPSSINSPLVIGFIILILILLLVIGLLANLLIGVAQVKRQKEKKAGSNAKLIVTTALFLLFFSNSLWAGDNLVAKTSEIISGVSSTAFYLIISVIFLELLIILGLLINVRILLKVEKEAVEKVAAAFAWKAKFIKYWALLNSFKSKEQEADIDLGHDYDGIRELDNRLPPWWLYGFYLTIIVAGIYLYRFHVSHTGPTGIQEYETAVARADIDTKEYLKSKGEAVDENTVTLLTDPGDMAEGKTFFLKSCVACHNEGGAGNVGPNLTDDYWLHGGDLKNVFRTIRYGINAMPQWQNSYSNKQIAELASYVKSLQGTRPANAKAPEGVLENDKAAPGKSLADSTAKTASVTAIK
ncbi:MAG: cbb3-type cytochrome c oxidase N-terminal domain-containing protein [Chitinophagaceae bacterium]